MRNWSLASIVIMGALISTADAGELEAGAAAVNLVADDSMVIGGGIGPRKAVGQEGELRVSAVVIKDPRGDKVALIECDVLMVDGAGHWPHREASATFDRRLLAFLAGLPEEDPQHARET